jgi:hypothetical protein
MYTVYRYKYMVLAHPKYSGYVNLKHIYDQESSLQKKPAHIYTHRSETHNAPSSLALRPRPLPPPLHRAAKTQNEQRLDASIGHTTAFGAASSTRVVVFWLLLQHTG